MARGHAAGKIDLQTYGPKADLWPTTISSWSAGKIDLLAGTLRLVHT